MEEQRLHPIMVRKISSRSFLRPYHDVPKCRVNRKKFPMLIFSYKISSSISYVMHGVDRFMSRTGVSVPQVQFTKPRLKFNSNFV